MILMIYKITANICGNETRRQICCQGYLDRSCSSKNSSKSTMSNQKKEATSLTIEATVSLPDMLTNNNIFGNARIHSIVCPKCVHGDMITGEILDIQPTDIRPYHSWCVAVKCPKCNYRWYVCRDCSNVRQILDTKKRPQKPPTENGDTNRTCIKHDINTHWLRSESGRYLNLVISDCIIE